MTISFTLKPWHFALLAFVAGIALTTGIALALTSGSSHKPSQQALAAVVTPTEVPPTATAVPPTPVPPPPPAPPLERVVLPDRTNCAEIRGTDYRSATERLWFLANCSPTPTPASSANTCYAEPGFQYTYFAVEEKDLVALKAKQFEPFWVWDDPQNGSFVYVRGPNRCFAIIFPDQEPTAICRDGFKSTDPTDLRCATHGGIWINHPVSRQP